MPSTPITDADERYLELIAIDCERVLGPGIEIERLELERDGNDAVLHLGYRLGTNTGSTDGRGPDPLAAHADLRQRLVEDRLAVGFRALVGS